MTSTTPNSTGPRTEAGKVASSRNALKNGLFADRDFILADEHEEYTDTLTRLWAHLQPTGVLQETFATEIMTATWRLRRCRLVESDLAFKDLSDEDSAKQQTSVDRARAQANNTLRRSTAELRKLQTEQAIRAELCSRGFDTERLPGLADARQLLSAIQKYEHPRKHDSKPANIKAFPAQADRNPGMQTQMGSSFCNSPEDPKESFMKRLDCPCNSGEKFRRCCGKVAA